MKGDIAIKSEIYGLQIMVILMKYSVSVLGQMPYFDSHIRYCSAHEMN